MAPRVVQPGKGLEDPPALMSQDRTQKRSSSPLPVLPTPASWTPRNPPEDVGVLRPLPGHPKPRCSAEGEEAEGQWLVGRLRPEAWESPSRAGLHRQDRGAGRPASSLPEEPRDPRPGTHSPCPGPCHLNWPSCDPNVHLFGGDERLALRDAP